MKNISCKQRKNSTNFQKQKIQQGKILEILRKSLNMSKKSFISSIKREYNNYTKKFRFDLIKDFFIKFFQNKKIINELEECSDYELTFILAILYKKNFDDFNLNELNIFELQSSKVSKRKDHLIKFLLKKIFKYIFKSDPSKYNNNY